MKSSIHYNCSIDGKSDNLTRYGVVQKKATATEIGEAIVREIYGPGRSNFGPIMIKEGIGHWKISTNPKGRMVMDGGMSMEIDKCDGTVSKLYFGELAE